MKKIWMRLTAVFACLTLIGAGASIHAFGANDPETGLTIYSTQPALHYVTESGAHTITDYYGGNTRKIIVIPNDVAGNPFSKIRSGAFEGIQTDAIFVPDTMMEIAPGAFEPGTRIKVYAAGDYRGFTQPTYQKDASGRQYMPDPDTSMLTVKSDTPYYSTVTVNGVSYRQEGISATVTGYSGTETELRIAPSVNGLPVTTVESGALKDAALTKLYLPKSVTRVEEGALGEYEVVFRADTGSGVTTEEEPSVPEYISSSEEEVRSSEEDQSNEESRSNESGSGNEPQTGSTERSGNETAFGSEETDVTSEIGTFDMESGEFVSTEAEESGSEEETGDGTADTLEPEDESGTETEEKTADGPDESKPAGGSGEEKKNEEQKADPWIFVAIGGAVIIVAAAAALIIYFRKRSGK